MRRGLRTCLMASVLVLGSLIVSGCAGGVRPKGQVFLNGEPYKLTEGEKMTVSFASADGKGGASSSDVAKDGSFSVQGQGLPAGPYKINVISNMTGPNVPDSDRYNDKFKGAFNGPNTPLQIDLTSGDASSVMIDLGAKTVTKK